MKKGDKRLVRTTGRFETREELEIEVARLTAEGCSGISLARQCGISQSSIGRILNPELEKRTVRPEDSPNPLNQTLNTLWAVRQTLRID